MGERAVSVVIPTHDRVRSLERTLRSVLCQRDVSLEVVVVDDGSTDDTPAFLHEHEDDRVQVRRHPKPCGVAHARNDGLATCSGAWVAFVDDDDLWSPDHLAAAIDAAEATGAAWACSDAVLVDDRLEVIGAQRAPEQGDVWRTALQRNPIPGGGSAVVARRDAVEEVGGFDPTFPLVADWDLWVRLAERGPVASVDRPHVAYQVHDGSASLDVARMHAARDALMAKHAAARHLADVVPDDRWWDAYVLGRQRVASLRRDAARSRLGSSGRTRDLVAAGLTLVAPQAVEDRQRRRAVRQLPAGWLEEAERWLAPYRNPAGSASISAPRRGPARGRR